MEVFLTNLKTKEKIAEKRKTREETESKPINPKPINPKPSNPKPINPKPSNPKPSNPKPSNPKLALDHWRVEISTHWPNLVSAILIWRVQF